MTIACNPDGTVHWTAEVNNQDRCSRTENWTAMLQVKTGVGGGNESNWMTVEVEHGVIYLPGKDKATASGDFCFVYPSNTTKQRVVFKIDSPEEHCHPSKKSPEIQPCPVTPTCALGFPDVPVNSTFYPEIMGMKAVGAVSGFADGSFRPSATINRGQIAKMVVIAFGLGNIGGSDQHFSDVRVGSTYYTYIESAYSRGLITGYGDGTFRPYDRVTRGQIAKIVVQAAGYVLVTPARATFSDVPTNHVFYKYIETAYSHQILSGFGDGTFRPDNVATRGQVSKIINLPLSDQ
jgi:hypothetical protein